MSSLTIRGVVSVESCELPLARVKVVAIMPAGVDSASKDYNQAGPLLVGRAVTDSDGMFEIQTDENEPLVSRAACVLRSCAGFKFHLACFDRDDTLLHETAPLSYVDDLHVEIEVQEPETEPDSRTWKELSRRMIDSQTVRFGDVAVELATLLPRGVFADWTVAHRVSVLGRLEQALLDPDNVLGKSGIRVGFSQLVNEAEVMSLREQFHREERRELLEALDVSLGRVRTAGGIREMASFLDPEALKQGDTVSGVNKFLEPNIGIVASPFPWGKNPLVGYRDYLRDRWVENQRLQLVLGQGYKAVATAATLIARLNSRFHQDFATKNTTEQPANRVLVRILLKILRAAVGTGYGFGIAPASIEGQEGRSYREYLDYLISKTGLKLEELEKRYRLNLKRSDLESSNPVQQNIDTLQRFFTDSYQSVIDPFAIMPDRIVATDELLIIKFPPEAAGPFFLEYEEWLERENPFYPENYYDPRATYKWTIYERLQKTRDLVFANSIPLTEFVESKKNAYNHPAARWQWVRNHIDLHDLIVAAHNDAKSLNYVAGEEKYAAALGLATQLRKIASAAPAGWWQYDAAAFAKEQKKGDVSSIEKLTQYEVRYHRRFGHHYDSSAGTIISDLLPGNAEISEHWWGKDEAPFFWHGNKREIRYLLDYLQFRFLPACLSEMQLASGKYAEAVRQLIGPAAFNIFTAAPSAEVFKDMANAGTFRHFTGGPLPYASSSDRTQYPTPDPPTSVPTNRAELGYFKLKLGNAALEWADVLYRSNQSEYIMRARELFKGVLFLHNEDPEITPTWDRRERVYLLFPFQKGSRSPAVVGQVNRARLGFIQINAGLNYYGVSPSHVPPVRFRVLKEAADRFAAGARGAQSDFLGYMQQLDQLTVNEMTARAMVAKANAAISIAQEEQKIAEFHVGEAQKQVDAINAQIAAKKAEIAKADGFFEQVKDFAGGMKDSVSKLAELAFAGEAAPEAASAQNLSTGDILKLGYKVGTATNVLGGATSALGNAGGVAGPFGAFLYAGVTSMSSLADAVAKRAGELSQLQNVALPAANKLVDLKKRDVTIAQLSQTIARADWQLGRDLLAYYSTRLINRAFLIALTEFSNRLMRRYLDLGGKMAWLAERALAFEQDREVGIIAFDYFPRNLRGVTGADLLQLHLAELEAARIQGLTQTIPVKHTLSLARDHPIQFGQLKKTGFCRFTTTEEPLQWVYPGVYGYRVRNVTIAATYAAAIQPHRGLFSNQGVSMITRDKQGTAHTLIRYPDALPLSEFRMRDDMWVFDLPDETLLPFEGSGFETVWELMLSKIGNASGYESMTDMLITFDMRASYSAFLEEQHIAALPASATRSLLVSAKAMNPGVLAKFRKDGGQAMLAFDLATIAHNANETARSTLNFTLIAVGTSDAPFTASFSSTAPQQSEAITFEKGLALSNAGVLSGGNGGVPLPLNTFAGIEVDQTFTLTIDTSANAGTDFTNLADVLLLAEYEAKL